MFAKHKTAVHVLVYPEIRSLDNKRDKTRGLAPRPRTAALPRKACLSAIKKNAENIDGVLSPPKTQYLRFAGQHGFKAGLPVSGSLGVLP